MSRVKLSILRALYRRGGKCHESFESLSPSTSVYCILNLITCSIYSTCTGICTLYYMYILQ